MKWCKTHEERPQNKRGNTHQNRKWQTQKSKRPTENGNSRVEREVCWHRSPSVVGVLVLHGNVRGKGDQHYNGMRGGKKSFRERCRFLSEVLSLSVLLFGMPSYWDCTLMRTMEICMMRASCIKNTKCTCASVCPSGGSIRCVQCGSWTEASFLCLVICVSCCQRGISLQGIRYCNRGALSGWSESELLVDRKAPKPSGKWKTH